MKKTIIILFITLIAIFSFSQEKINGFGRLKLGMSVSDLPELNDLKLIQIRNKNDYFRKAYHSESNEVFEMFPDTNEEYNIVGSLDKRVRSFHIGNIYITDNINIKNVDLKFFDGKLYEIAVNETNSDSNDNAKKLAELLTAKYGEPKTDIKTEEKHYTNGYGTDIIKKNITLNQTFNTNSLNISCYYHVLAYHDSKGKLSIIEYIRLSETNISTLVYEEVNKQESIIKNRIAKREEDKKKELLIGF